MHELIEGRFGVGSGRHLAMRKPRAALSGKIANQLYLAAKRQHVRIKPRAEQHFGLNILRLAVRLGLGEDTREAAENLQECRHSSVVEGHRMLFQLVSRCRFCRGRKRFTRVFSCSVATSFETQPTPPPPYEVC